MNTYTLAFLLLFVSMLNGTLPPDAAAQSPEPTLRLLTIGNGNISVSGGRTRVIGTAGQSAVGSGSTNAIGSTLGFWSWAIAAAGTGPIAAGKLPAAIDIRPNVVSGKATIRLTLPQEGFVRVELLDMLGRCERTLLDETSVAGIIPLRLDASDLMPGMRYLCVSIRGRQISVPLLIVR